MSVLEHTLLHSSEVPQIYHPILARPDLENTELRSVRSLV